MNPLAVLALTTFGPTLLLGALQGGSAMPEWSRWAMGISGLAAMGVAARELLHPAPTDNANALVAGLQRELQHTSDPATALRLVLDHVRADRDYYTRGPI
jgi:hypothetical protein